jgi:hypothetical protein
MKKLYTLITLLTYGTKVFATNENIIQKSNNGIENIGINLDILQLKNSIA